MTASATPSFAARAGREDRETGWQAPRTLALPAFTAQAPPDSATRVTIPLGPATAPEAEAGEEDTTRAEPARRAPEKRSRFDAPRWVMIRSAVVPGWGQLHNGSWIKALAVAAGEAGIAWRLKQDNDALKGLEREIEAAQDQGDDELEDVLIERYNLRLDTYTGRQWLLGAVFAYSLLDAYIDAHFRSFKTDFEADPALPDGAPPVSKLRFGLRFSF